MPSDIQFLDHTGKPYQPDADRWEQRGEVVPHVLTFSSIWNTASKIYSYRFDEALNHLPENALAMRRDCYIRSLLQERAMPTVNRKWQIVPEDPKDQVQVATARTLTKIIKRIPRWKRLLKYLCEAQWYGKYGSQIVWRMRTVDGVGRWTIVRHRPVNGDKLQFEWDGTPAIAVNTLISTTGGAQQFPPEMLRTADRFPLLILGKKEWRRQFIIHTHEVDDADYFEGEMAQSVEGTGIRGMIYWCWWMRDEGLAWAVDFFKKIGTMGLLVIPYEQGNPNSKLQAEENARKASTDTVITMPVYVGVDKGRDVLKPIHIPSDSSGIEALSSMIKDYFEKHIERLVIGQSMSSGGGGAGGLEGDGRADFAKDTKFQLLHFDADNLAETLTADLVWPCQQLNFPQFDFQCRFEFIVEDPDKQAKTDAIKTFGPMGMTFRMDECRELTGMSEPEEGEEILGAAPQKPGSGDGGEGNGEGKEGGKGDDWNFETLRSRERPTLYAKDAGRWITIGAKNGEGGTPVFIQNGRITKGAPGLTGKSIGNLKGEAADQSRRAENKSSSDYETAKHVKAARKSGIDPKHLHALAADIHVHGNVGAQEHNDLLKHAREHAEKIHARRGEGSLNGLAIRARQGNLDHTKLPHFDEIASSAASAFPGHFRDKEDASQELFDKLLEGNREGMSREDAYREALGHLQGEKEAGRYRSGKKPADDEEIPFQANEPLLAYAKETYDEDQHPRDANGRWIPKGDIAEAAKDPQKRKQLEAGLDERNKAKLLAAIEAENDPSNDWKHAGRSKKKQVHVWQHQHSGSVSFGGRPLERRPAEVRQRELAWNEQRARQDSSTYIPTDHKEEIERNLATLFPPEAGVKAEKLHELIGLPKGAAVTVLPTPGGGVKLRITHPFVKDWQRTIQRKGDKLECHNDFFFMKPRYQGSGFGADAFASQVKQCSQAGIEEITTDAGKNLRLGKSYMNGYMTWPRLGYDAPLGRWMREMLPAPLRDCESVSELIKTKEGRDAWTKVSTTITPMTFDLEPGSKSMRVLNDYLAEKGKPNVEIDAEKRQRARR